MAKCFECAMGEHDNYDEDVVRTQVIWNGRVYRTANMCRDHRTMYEDDGYVVKLCKKTRPLGE